jgi:hypothetical protein
MLYNTLYAVMTVVQGIEATSGLIIMGFAIATLASWFDMTSKAHK